MVSLRRMRLESGTDDVATSRVCLICRRAHSASPAPQRQVRLVRARSTTARAHGVVPHSPFVPACSATSRSVARTPRSESALAAAAAPQEYCVVCRHRWSGPGTPARSAGRAAAVNHAAARQRSATRLPTATTARLSHGRVRRGKARPNRNAVTGTAHQSSTRAYHS